MPERNNDIKYYAYEEDSKGVNVFKIIGITLYIIIALCYCVFVFINAKAGAEKKEADFFGNMIFTADRDVFPENTYTETPDIDKGAVVFAKKISVIDLKKNDIIVYNTTVQSPALTTKLARVIEVTESQEPGLYIITIDNPENQTERNQIVQQQLLGIAVYKISHLGILFDFLKSKWGIILIIVIPSLLFLTLQIIKLVRILKSGDDSEEEQNTVGAAENDLNKDGLHERTFEERVGRDPDEVLKDNYNKKINNVLKKHFDSGVPGKNFSEEIKKFEAEKTKGNYNENSLDKTIMNLYRANEKPISGGNNSGNSAADNSVAEKEPVFVSASTEPKKEKGFFSEDNAQNLHQNNEHSTFSSMDDAEKNNLEMKLKKEVEQLTKEVPRRNDKKRNIVENDDYITTKGLTKLGVKAKLAQNGLEIYVDKTAGSDMVFKFDYDGKNVVISSDEYEAQIDLN